MRILKYLPRSVKSLIGAEQKFALRRRYYDLRPSTTFILSAAARREGRRELAACDGIPDLLGFARRWLGVGSVQVPDEIGALISYLRSVDPKTVCEIGTESCGTSLLLSRGLPTVELLICVDLFVMNGPRLRAFVPDGQLLRIINGMSAAAKTIRRVTGALSGRPLDVLFIDGDHRYGGVCGDFLAYRHFVRPGGIVVFHDIVPDYNARFGTPTGRSAGDVPEFWAQMKSLYEHRVFVNDPAQDGFGIGIIIYDPDVDPVPALRHSV